MAEFTHEGKTFDTNLNNVMGKIGSNSCTNPNHQHQHTLIPISDNVGTPYEFTDQADFDVFKAKAGAAIAEESDF